MTMKLHILGAPFRLLRYGENPQQAWAEHHIVPGDNHRLSLHNFRILGDTNPGWVNTVDVHRGIELLVRIAAGWERNFLRRPLISVIVKHGNACGAGVGATETDALCNAVLGDPEDMFGGVVLTNFPLTTAHVQILKNKGAGEKPRVLGGIVAPIIAEGAVELVQRKDGKCFAMENPVLIHAGDDDLLNWGPVYRHVLGGMLVQKQNTFVLNFEDTNITYHGPTLTSPQKIDLILAQAVAWCSNSNTTTLVHDGKVIGNGVGQQGRGRSCRLAVLRAYESQRRKNLHGSVAASDSFFPALDGPEALHEAMVSAIFATSGSTQDDAVIQFCVQHGISLVRVPDTVGRGFAAH